MKNSISCHQIGVIAGILIWTLKLSVAPGIIYSEAGSSSLLFVFILIAFNALFLGLIIWLKTKYPKMSFYEILKSKIGVILAKLIYILLFVFFVFKLLSIMSDGYGFIKGTTDEEFTLGIFVLCFLPIISFLAYSGIRNLARTTEFFYPIILLFFVIAIIFSFVPIIGFNFGAIFSGTNVNFFAPLFRMSFWLGDLFVFLILLDKLDIQKDKFSKLFTPFAICSVLMFVLYALYYILYQETSFFHTIAICDIVQYSVSSVDGWHMDILSIIVFMLSIYFQGAVIMYCLCDCIKKVLNINNDVCIYIFLNVLIIACQFLFMTDYFRYVEFARTFLCYFASIFLPLLTILIIIFALLKRRKRNEKISK